MARIPHAAQIDLCFGDAARELLDFRIGVGPGNFARKRFHLLGQGWIGTNRQAQPMAKRVSRRANAAPSGLRAVLARAFARLALILRSLVKPRFFLWLALSRSLKLGVLDLLHAPSQRFAEDRPTPIDLAQGGIAAALGDGDKAIDPLDIVEFLGECIRQKASMLTPAPARSSSTSVTASGSRRTYSCTSSFAFRPAHHPGPCQAV